MANQKHPQQLNRTASTKHWLVGSLLTVSTLSALALTTPADAAVDGSQAITTESTAATDTQAASAATSDATVASAASSAATSAADNAIASDATTNTDQPDTTETTALVTINVEGQASQSLTVHGTLGNAVAQAPSYPALREYDPAKYDITVTTNGATTFTDDDTDNVTITITHKHQTVSADLSGVTSTRTINFDNVPADADGTLTNQTQTVKWAVDTDLVTGTVTYEPMTNRYISYVFHQPTGYQATSDDIALTTSGDNVIVAPTNIAATTTLPTDLNMTITFVPAQITGQIVYVDSDDKDRTVTTIRFMGYANQLQFQIPDDYEIDTLPALLSQLRGSNQLAFNTLFVGQDMTLTVALTHAHQTGTLTTTRTITFTGAPTNTDSSIATQTQSLQWTTDTDLVTGITTYTPTTSGYDNYHFVVPTGYTVTSVNGTVLLNGAQATVDKVPLMTTTTLPTNQKMIVRLSPVAVTKQVQLVFVDDDNSDQTVTTTTLTTAADQLTFSIPANYVLSGDLPAFLTWVAGTDELVLNTQTIDQQAIVTVHLAHAHQVTNLATTRTITFTGVPANADQTVTNQSQTLNWTADTDLVTGVTTYTPAGNGFAAYQFTVPTGFNATGNDITLDGHQATVSAIPLAVTTTLPTDQSVTVAFTPAVITSQVTFVDDDNDGQTVTAVELTGHADQMKFQLPTNYLLKGSLPTLLRQIAGTNELVLNSQFVDPQLSLTVHLAHAHQYLGFETSGVTTTQTIAFTNVPAGANATVKQQTQIIRWATDTDLVTGEVVYTPETMTAVQYQFDQPAGYQATSTNGHLTTTNNLVTVTLNPATAATTLPSDQTTTVRFAPAVITGHLVFVDHDNQQRVVTTTDFANYANQLRFELPTNYVIDGDLPATLSYYPGANVLIFNTNALAQNQTLTVRLGHRLVTEKQQKQLTIAIDGSQNNEVLTFTRTMLTDLVTGEVTYSNWSNDNSFATLTDDLGQNRFDNLFITAHGETIAQIIAQFANQLGNADQVLTLTAPSTPAQPVPAPDADLKPVTVENTDKTPTLVVDSDAPTSQQVVTKSQTVVTPQTKTAAQAAPATPQTAMQAYQKYFPTKKVTARQNNQHPTTNQQTIADLKKDQLGPGQQQVAFASSGSNHSSHAIGGGGNDFTTELGQYFISLSGTINFGYAEQNIY